MSVGWIHSSVQSFPGTGLPMTVPESGNRTSLYLATLSSSSKVFPDTTHCAQLRQKNVDSFVSPGQHDVSVVDTSYSGASGLRLGVGSPEQPLVPTGVKSPSCVSGRTEAVK